MRELNLVHSQWHPAQIAARSAPLRGRTQADVVIVGGGISGLSAAYHLARRGLDVVLLERGAIGSQSSTRNYGILDTEWDLDDPDPQRRRDQARYLQGCAGRLKAVLDAEGIDAGYREGVRLWRLARTAKEARQAQAMAAKLLALGYVAGFDEGPRISVTTEQVPGAMWLEQAEVDPSLLIAGLYAAILRHGVRVFEDSPVTRIEDGNPFIAETAGGAVAAKVGVIAANGASSGFSPAAGYAMPAQIFSLATRPLPDAIADTIGPAGGDSVLDMDERRPFTQRFMPDRRLWFGAGVITIPGADELAQPRLTARAARTIVRELIHRYPALTPDDIDYWWGGTLCRSAGGKPLIGRVPDTRATYLAITCLGKGMALGSSTGELLADLIAPDGRPDPLRQAFHAYCSPARRPFRRIEQVAHGLLRGPLVRPIANFVLGS